MGFQKGSLFRLLMGFGVKHSTTKQGQLHSKCNSGILKEPLLRNETNICHCVTCMNGWIFEPDAETEEKSIVIATAAAARLDQPHSPLPFLLLPIAFSFARRHSAPIFRLVASVRSHLKTPQIPPQKGLFSVQKGGGGGSIAEQKFGVAGRRSCFYPIFFWIPFLRK